MQQPLVFYFLYFMKIKREDFFKDKVRVLDVGTTDVVKLLEEMSETAFQGRKLGEAFLLWKKMLEENENVIFMGLAGSMATAGMWKLICQTIRFRYIDVLVSTGANISEDIYAGMGFPYGRGSPMINDSILYELGIDRFYDTYADEYLYREMEKTIKDFALTLKEDYIYSSSEFLYLFGKYLNEHGIYCIATEAYKQKVPIFSPAIVDSAYGVALLLAKKEGKHIKIDHIKDYEQMVEISKRIKNTSVIYIGGGVPKDMINLVAVAVELLKAYYENSNKKERDKISKPHKYALQITTDSPQWGGLSGATLEEAVSWGKVSKGDDKVTCYCDATIALPLLINAIYKVMKDSRRNIAPRFDWLFERVEGLTC